ncbi:MAG: response regulator, partial [Leptospiraceae bacterium]|nr:response regulator [Leptospiraceae bacterium]
MVKLLVIEDDPIDLKILVKNIKNSQINKFDICCVVNLKSALDKLKKSKFDVIICDLGLSDSFGVNIIKKLNLVSPETPLIIATNNSNEEIIADVFNLGADDYLLKEDLSTKNICRSIRNAIERKKLVNNLAESTRIAGIESMAKSSFLAKMSHEIRTPLNLIIGTAELLNETELNKQQEKYVSTFEKASMHLLTIIDNILDMSKIESGDLNIQNSEFSLENEILKIADLIILTCRSRKIFFDFYFDSKLPNLIVGDA